MLTPGDEIRNLLGRYTELVDAGDWDRLGALFADGALATEDGTVLARGAVAVAGFYRGGTILHDGSPRTKHLVSGTVLDFDAPAGSVPTAVARSSYVVLQQVGDGSMRQIVAGRYVDSFDRGPGGDWHFAERRFAIDMVGDLSNHLTWEL